MELDTFGEDTELDRNIVEELGDPLMHMVRNAIDHGIESPEVRHADGKPPTARVTLRAAHRGGHICLEVSDDGRGLDKDKIVMEYPMPVIIISSLGQASCKAAIEALQSGAVEVLAKPGGPYSVGELRLVLAAKIRAAAAARVRTCKAMPPGASPATLQPVHPGSTVRRDGFDLNKVIAIGASTGGTEAIAEVLMRIPDNCPPIVITQHIPANFSRAFAERLDRICPMAVKEAADGDELAPGLALVAPGNFHMLLRKRPGGYFVSVKDGPRVCYQKPSVDVMFRSVAEAASSKAVGVLLTGMGADGAAGMLQMKQAGAHTIAQDEASCVVFGVPREAIRLGAADHVQSLTNIPGAILSAVRAKSLAT